MSKVDGGLWSSLEIFSVGPSNNVLKFSEFVSGRSWTRGRMLEQRMKNRKHDDLWMGTMRFKTSW